ncbi:MAG: integration host factor, actinobacterial type [Miltoncostaeaceae bacterium]
MATPPKTAQTPQRSLDQRLDALRRANEIRSLRAKLKKDLKSGDLSVDEVIAEPIDDFVLTAKVFDIIVAAPKYGKVKATRLLNQCRISQGKTLGGLSERQRIELIDLLKQR